MDWGWFLDRYPEIAHLPPAEQNQLVETARRRLVRDVRHWALGTFAVVLPMAGLLLSTFFRPSSKQTTVLFVLAWFALLMGAHVLAIRYRYAAVRRAIRVQLLQQGVRPARCFDCGYDLRAAEAARCPECGAPFCEERS